MKRLLLLFALASLGLGGCKEKPAADPAGGKIAEPAQSSAPAPTPRPLLQTPLEPSIVELPTEALPVWRQYRAARPVLVLLSQDPLLASIPPKLREETLALVREGSREELSTRIVSQGANPLLLPSMALSTALEAGLFSRVVWMLPAEEAMSALSVETFRAQLLELGAVDENEASSFALTADGVFSGTVRGVPFLAVHPDALPDIAEPVVLHIDLTFFQPLYKGEIKTPLYPLLAQTLDRLRQKQWQASAVTISLSNMAARVPLASRFAGKDLDAFFRDPAMFDRPLPESWSRRARALYLENFFKKEEVRELYREMEKEAPKDPSVQYALYDIARQFKEGDRAIDCLGKAVQLDRVYALEYLALAEVAREQQLPDQVLRMLTLAHSALPDNPFVKLHLAEQLIAVGRRDDALRLIRELQELPWSTVYYPDLPEHLRKLQQP